MALLSRAPLPVVLLYRYMKNIILIGTLALAALHTPALCAQELEFPHSWVLPGDSLIINIPDFADIYPRSLRLTEEDYQRVAEEMGIDVATRKQWWKLRQAAATRDL